MRWCAALALVLVALVVLTVMGTRRSHKRVATVNPDLAELAAPPAIAPGHASAPPPIRRESGGIAHLRGRALLPAGVDGAERLPALRVTADDGRRSFAAGIMPGGRFGFHMPPGRYALTARAGDLVGELRGVFVAIDLEREVEIPLVAGARIGGRLHRPANADVHVMARPTGGERPVENGDTSDDAFMIDGLMPGRRYDLEFSGVNIRTLKLTGVTAPAEAMDVAVEAGPIVRVAVGFPVGAECPIDTLKVRSGDQDDEVERGFVGDRIDCRFELLAPRDARFATIVAQGNGWLLQGEVTIPEHGDPEPICLNPPCRANPREGFAQLRVALEGVDDDSYIWVDADLVNNPEGTRHGCGASGGAACDIEGLRPGQTFSLRASGNECHAQPITVTLVGGDNHVRIPCRRDRKIEGVVRIPDGQQPDEVTVRCAGGDPHPMKNTRVFSVSCAADVAALEYQIGSQGIWRSIPIASLTSPAFVDIGPF